MICPRCRVATRRWGEELCDKCRDERAEMEARELTRPKSKTKPGPLQIAVTQVATVERENSRLKALLERWCRWSETPETHAPDAFIDLYNETLAALEREV
jgi:hypothetical protein